MRDTRNLFPFNLQNVDGAFENDLITSSLALCRVIIVVTRKIRGLCANFRSPLAGISPITQNDTMVVLRPGKRLLATARRHFVCMARFERESYVIFVRRLS